jgi:HD-like signal output (HDOD) protein
MNQDKLTLKEWTRRLSEEDMPVFAHTARSIAAASSEDDTPIAELAQYILRDSSMTARILRLANSVYYNPGGQAVNTISRAIVFLGFNVVRSMAITIAILEPLLKGVQHERVLEEMARSFHAAVQAKAISQARGNEDAEAVFVAALLNRLGNMAFWCFPYGKAKEMDSAYQHWDDPQQAEAEVLGFPFSQLTMALNKEWKLSELLNESLSGVNRDDPQNLDLQQANQLVMAVEEGWGSINTKQLIDTLASRLNQPKAEIEEMLQHNAFEAAKTAIEYGAEAASRFIPLPQLNENDEVLKGIPDSSHKPDISLQMGILRELTAMLHEKVDLNAVLGTIMEGIYRALGMERTVIAFVTGNENILQAKYVLGDDKEKLKRCFQFPVTVTEKNLFAHLLKAKQPCWVNAKTRSEYDELLTKDIKQCLGVLDFFVMPIWIGNKGKGIIYADCKLSGRKLTMDEFQTFSHFSEYATIAFDLHSKK